MVSFFSFFKWRSTPTPAPDTEQDKDGQGQEQRGSSAINASAPPTGTNSDTAIAVNEVNRDRGSTGAHRARPGRFLSLRRRSSKPYDQNQNSTSLRRSGSTDGDPRRRRSQQLSRDGLTSLYTPLKLDLPIGVNGSDSDPLGLYAVGGHVNLTPKERDVLNQIRLTAREVQKGWQWFDSALKALGMDKSGLMLPLRTSTSTSLTAQAQSHILALYILTIRPTLISSFPSITSYYPSSDDNDVWQDRLLAALRDVQSPYDIAEMLKWTLRRMTPAQGQGIITKEQYVKYVQAEHALSYPLDAYDVCLKIDHEPRAYLDQVFEVLAGIATHAEENSMSAGRLAYLLGLWILSDLTTPKEKSEWKALYKIWKERGERTEHLMYAWIRYQSTKQHIPIRLLELVDQYPFGESSASSEHLPLPPPSSFSRRTLHITLSSNSPLDGLFSSIADLVKAAIGASSIDDSSVPLWSSLVRQDDTPAELNDILSEESREFLRSAAAVPAHTPSSSPVPKDFVASAANEDTVMYRPFSTISSGRTSPRTHARQRSQSHTIPSPTEKTHLALPAPDDDTVTQTKDDSPKSIRKQASTSAIPKVTGDSTIWDSFQQSGFGDSPGTSGDLALALTPKSETFSPMSPKSPTTPISPFASSLKRGQSTSRPAAKRKTTFQDEHEKTPVFQVAKEEVVDIDDVFIAFVEDGQLDSSVSSDWPPFALIRLREPINQASAEDKPIERLLITVEHRPPPHPPTPSNMSEPELLARAASPSAASTTSRMSTTRGFKDFANSFKRSASFPSRPSTAPSGMRRNFFGASGRNLAKQAALEPLSEDTSKRELRAPPSAQSLAPIEYIIGEMGEIIKIPSMTENDNDDVNDNVDSQTTSNEWKYVAEGGAHIVFAYRGTSPSYIGKVLRIRKFEPTTTTNDQTELQREWRFNLLPKLLPEELLLKAEEVVLEQNWLKATFALADQSRPESRKNGVLADSVDGTRRGLLMENTTAAPVDSGKDSIVLSVEIKPKWGFLPEAKWLQPPESINIKTHNCRFCMHRHLKETAATEYCPLDLYSGSEERIRKALHGLWGSWRDTEGKGNNWRVYVDGVQTGPAQAQNIPTLNEDILTGTADWFLPVLQQSNVFERLATLQSSLDATDISYLATCFTSSYPDASLFDASLIPAPTLVELKEFVDLYLSNPSAGKEEEGWNLRQRLIAYSLSAIFKDCSIFIKCPLTRSSSEDKWELDLERSEVKVIDLDIKPIQNMKQWYDLDTKIWQHYLKTRSDTKECVLADTRELETPKKRKAVPSLLNLGSPEEEQDSSSTRALFVPTPAPSTTVTVGEMELDRMSFLDALAISPTKPVHNHNQSGNTEEVPRDAQEKNLDVLESLQDSRDDRRERSLAPSPSPSLAPVKLHDTELPAVSDTGETAAGDIDIASPVEELSKPSIIEKDTQESIAQEEERQSGVLATVGAAAVGVIGGIATAVGLAETSDDIPKEKEDVAGKEEAAYAAPLEADVDASATMEAEVDQPVSEVQNTPDSPAEKIEQTPLTPSHDQEDVEQQEITTSAEEDEISPAVALHSEVLDSKPAATNVPEAESDVQFTPVEAAEEDKVEALAAATSTFAILHNAESGSPAQEVSIRTETAIPPEDLIPATPALPAESTFEQDEAESVGSDSAIADPTVASTAIGPPIDQSLPHNSADKPTSENLKEDSTIPDLADVVIPILAAATASDILLNAEQHQIVDEKDSHPAELPAKVAEDHKTEAVILGEHVGQQGEEVENLKPSDEIALSNEEEAEFAQDHAVISLGENEQNPQDIQQEQDGSSMEQVVIPSIQEMVAVSAPVGEEENPTIDQKEEGSRPPAPADDNTALPETTNEDPLAHSISEPNSSTGSKVKDGSAPSPSEEFKTLDHEDAISSKAQEIALEEDDATLVPEITPEMADMQTGRELKASGAETVAADEATDQDEAVADEIVTAAEADSESEPKDSVVIQPEIDANEIPGRETESSAMVQLPEATTSDQVDVPVHEEQTKVEETSKADSQATSEIDVVPETNEVQVFCKEAGVESVTAQPKTQADEVVDDAPATFEPVEPGSSLEDKLIAIPESEEIAATPVLTSEEKDPVAHEKMETEVGDESGQPDADITAPEDSLTPVESDAFRASLIREVQTTSESPVGSIVEPSADERPVPADKEEDDSVIHAKADESNAVEIPASKQQPTLVKTGFGQNDIPELGAPIPRGTEGFRVDQDQPIETSAEPEVETDAPGGTLLGSQTSAPAPAPASVEETSALDDNEYQHEIDHFPARVALPESNDGESSVGVNDNDHEGQEQEQTTPLVIDDTAEVESATEELDQINPANVPLPLETDLLELETENENEKESPSPAAEESV